MNCELSLFFPLPENNNHHEYSDSHHDQDRQDSGKTESPGFRLFAIVFIIVITYRWPIGIWDVIAIKGQRGLRQGETSGFLLLHCETDPDLTVREVCSIS